MYKLFCILCISCFLFSANAQEAFTVHVIPATLTGVPALHSGAFANYNGKWIFIGGRIDGMHILQANQAFEENLRNDSIFIVDPVTGSHQSVSARQLPALLSEPLRSTNMEYYQNGNYLYMIGGYGLSDSLQRFTTFPILISAELGCLINKVDSGSAINNCFRYITDSSFAVTGGEMDKIDSTYYLVFGHNFEGRYASTPSGLFTQHYTHDIRKFKINDDGLNLSISNYVVDKDTDIYHRRDFNLVKQIFPNHERGLTAFGGVFQKNAVEPFLTPIEIKSNSVTHQSGFNENLNQYTTAFLPLYDSVNNYMHTVFFGGMSLYTLDTSTMSLTQDTAIPFVSTISAITRDAAGNLSESKILENMPALKGTNAYFIPDSLQAYKNGILFMNELSGNTRVGYIAGGIHSDAPNVANVDPVGMSRANSVLYEVWVDKTVTSIPELTVNNSINNLQGFPNPAKDIFTLKFSVQQPANTEIKLFNYNGELIKTLLDSKVLNGAQSFKFSLDGVPNGMYLCKVHSGKSDKVLNVVIAR